MTIQFDTHRYVERLRSAGVPESQATAKLEALEIVLSESASGQFVRTDELASVSLDLAKIKAEKKLMKWMFLLLIGCVLLLVLQGTP